MNRSFLFTTLCIMFFPPFPSFAQDGLSYTERKGQEYFEDTTSTVDIYLFGLTTEKTKEENEKPLPGVTITMRDLYGETIQISSDDSSFYTLELAFDNKYLIYYEYEGMYTKYIEVDTRDVIDIEQERGYLLPTDMSLRPSENYKVAALYLNKPIGRLYFDRRLQIMAWDMEYTDKLKANIEKIMSKKK